MRGRAKRLSVPSRVIADVTRLGARIPVAITQRVMDLSAVIAARNALGRRPPWPGIFIKAYALVARDLPALREVYVPYPWPHVFEYQRSVASIAIARHEDNETFSFGLLISDPPSLSLEEIGRRINHAASAPIEAVNDIRRHLLVGRIPLPVRRLLLWLLFNIPRPRGRFVGSFGLSVLSSMGADPIHTLTMWTTLLSYGLFEADGKIPVRITFDHRVVGGATVARALVQLEQALNGPIVSELLQMAEPNCTEHAH
jgi:hypothetical protein